MPKVIDLSQSLGPGTANIPGHPPIEYRLIHTHEEHFRTNAVITFSVHVGTHVDPPYHFIPDGPTIDEVPLDRLMGPAHVFRGANRCRGRGHAPITVDDLLADGPLPKDGLGGKIVLINSGWAEDAYNKPNYYTEGPYLAVETAEWLVEQGVHAVGLENPPDDYRPGIRSRGDGPVHVALLSKGICIIENLCNMESLKLRDVWVSALPIKIQRGCGGTARVVAVED